MDTGAVRPAKWGQVHLPPRARCLEEMNLTPFGRGAQRVASGVA